MFCAICDRKDKLFKQKFNSMFCRECNTNYIKILDTKLLEEDHTCMKKKFEKNYIKNQRKLFSPVVLVKSYMKKLKVAMQNTTLPSNHPDYIEGHFIIANYHNGYLDPNGLWSLEDPSDRTYWTNHLNIVIKRLIEP